MKKAVLQFTACCMAIGISVTGYTSVAFADQSVALAGVDTSSVSAMEEAEAEIETESEITLAGLIITDLSDSEEAAEEDTEEDSMETAEPEEEETKESEDEEEETETEEPEPVYDSSMNGERAFAQCEDYINVRTDANTDGEVVGKIYNNCAVTILGKYGDWYEIESGNVTGYVKEDYFATGAEADAIAESVAYNVATVQSEALMVRAEPSEDAESIGMIYEADEAEVLSYDGDWMKVLCSDGTIGYINAWYVDYNTYYSTGETLEEEQERLDEEWLAYLAEQEAAAAAAEAAAAEAAAAEAYTETDYIYTEETYTYTEPAYTYTETVYEPVYTTTYSDVEAAYQNYLEKQAEADAACLQGDEQLVYDTYYAAIAAYQEYLDAVNAADAAAAGTTVQNETTYTTEQTYTEEQTYVEEPVYTEEQTYVEETVSSTSSTLGQSIADYAVQFVGNPYVYGGTSLTNGADCSGFTQSVFANFGISLPRTAAAQSGSGTSVSLSDIQAGDLLFYSDGGGISHVALYIGGGQVVHASSSTTGIIISNYTYRSPVCARRYW